MTSEALTAVAFYGTPSQGEAVTIRDAIGRVVGTNTGMSVKIERNRQIGEDPYTVVAMVHDRTTALSLIEESGEGLTDRRVRMAFKRTAKLAVDRVLPPRRRTA